MSKKSCHKIFLIRPDLTKQTRISLKHISKTSLFSCGENIHFLLINIDIHFLLKKEKKQDVIQKYSSVNSVYWYSLFSSIPISPVVSKLQQGKKCFHHTKLQHGEHHFQNNFHKFLFSVFKMKHCGSLFQWRKEVSCSLSFNIYLNHKFWKCFAMCIKRISHFTPPRSWKGKFRIISQHLGSCCFVSIDFSFPWCPLFFSCT